MTTTTSASQGNTGADERPMIELKGLNKWYGDFHVLRDINLSVRKGERIVICGPSGSGKSTMIRCINHLEEHQEGDIVVNGMPLTQDIKQIEAIRRNVGMVFQHFNLFPHLTVLENCCLAPIWVQKLWELGTLGHTTYAVGSNHENGVRPFGSNRAVEGCYAG